MASIWDWSLTAGTNASADSDIGWAEGQTPSSVNDSARQMMARIREYISDMGALSLAGTNTLTVTANSAYTAYATGQTLIARAANDNTGAVTLNVNSIGAKAIRKITTAGEAALAAGDIQAGQLCFLVYDAAANSAAGAWILANTADKVVGTDVQAYDAGLADIAALAVTDGNIIVGDGTNWVAESGATARTSLGLGTGDNVEFANITGDTILGAAANTAAAPAFAFDTDSDNGMLLVSTNVLGFATAGTRRWWLNDIGSWNLSGGASVLGVSSGTTNGISWQNGNAQLEISSALAPLNLQRTGTNGTIQNFYRGTTNVGSIDVTLTATTYNTSSDYRLKTNVRPLDPAILDCVRVYQFEWVNGDGTGMGVLAHELAEVLPEAVSGVKDDPERMQAVDYSKLVPLLVAKVQFLETRLAALEADHAR